MRIEDLIARRLAQHAEQRIATLTTERDAFAAGAQRQIDDFIRQVNERMIAYNAKIEEWEQVRGAGTAGNDLERERVAAGKGDAPGSA